MAKKKKEDRKITVKSPKKGEQYYFTFAGGIIKGTLGDRIERLEIHYGEKWYRMHIIEGDKEMRYPIPLRNIALTYEELK
jgi:hypothetical protein